MPAGETTVSQWTAGEPAMRIALVQQHATKDRSENLRRGLEALRIAASQGADLVCFAELAFEHFHPQRPAQGNVRDLAEPVPGPTTDLLCEAALTLGVD